MSKQDKEIDETPGAIAMTHDFYDAFKKEDVSVAIRFKKPTSKTAERAQKEMVKSPVRAFSNLCSACVLPEDKDAYIAAVKEYPGLATTFGGALLKSCGFGDLGN